MSANQTRLFTSEPEPSGFNAAMMDPPWWEKGGGEIERGANRHYPLIKTKDMPKVIIESGMWERVQHDAHLWMWVTNNFLEDGLWLTKQLGFRYITNSSWVKIRDKPLGPPDDTRHSLGLGPRDTAIDAARAGLQIGLGQYMRGAHELLLFAARGNAMVPPSDRRPPGVIIAERTRHSRKPDESYGLIETVSDGPYLEMFARSLRPNWTSWGNEV